MNSTETFSMTCEEIHIMDRCLLFFLVGVLVLKNVWFWSRSRGHKCSCRKSIEAMKEETFFVQLSILKEWSTKEPLLLKLKEGNQEGTRSEGGGTDTKVLPAGGKIDAV